MRLFFGKLRYHVNPILVLLFAGLFFPANAAQTEMTAEQIFYRAQVEYLTFIKEPEKQKFRDNWFPLIEKFKTAYTKNRDGELAAASLYMVGKLYHELYRRSLVSRDRERAGDYYRRVVERFTKSDYIKKAEKGLEELGYPGEVPVKTAQKNEEVSTGIPRKIKGSEFKRSKENYKKSKHEISVVSGPPQIHSEKPLQKTLPKKDLKTITGLRVWSNPNYTRVVIDADGNTDYTHEFLEQDPVHRKPERLYIDFHNTKMGEHIQNAVPINDDLLIDARAGQFRPDMVRVVVDIKSFKTYKIFSLRNPFRTIIDVWGTGFEGQKQPVYAHSTPSEKSHTRKPVMEKPALEKPDIKQPEKEDTSGIDMARAGNVPIKASDLAKQFCLGVKRIVIDPGHGGRDAGAVGYDRSVLEKHIVLSIAKRLASKIENELGCETILTRKTDRFISLEERTAIANTMNADLFISLHTNAHQDKRAYGIETYFLNLATDDDAMLVAARENATTKHNISDLQSILNDLMRNSKINESSRLAGYVQKSMHETLKQGFSHIRNKGVKQAPFYVLIGAQMPAILVETSFISNKRECNRLTRRDYQDKLCEGILKGIRSYIRETNPTALFRKGKHSG